MPWVRTRGGRGRRFKDARYLAYQETVREIVHQEIEMLDEKRRRELPIGEKTFGYVVFEIFRSREAYKTTGRADIDNISKGLIDSLSGKGYSKGKKCQHWSTNRTIFLDDPGIVLQFVLAYQLQRNLDQVRILVWSRQRLPEKSRN